MAEATSVMGEDRSLSWGARLAIGTFVLCQFVQVDFFVIGSIPVSLQKVSAAILLPISILLMREWLKINPNLVLIAATTVLAYSANGLYTWTLSPKLISADLYVVTNLFASLVLFTALVESEQGIRFLAWVCIVAAVISAVATVYQVVSMFPLDYRGTGFKDDPNFQALVLVIGVACAFVYGGRWRVELLAVIMTGIVATYSRMGIVAASAVLLVGSLMGAGVIRDLGKKGPFILIGATVAAVCGVYLGYEKLNTLIVQRLVQGWEQIRMLFSVDVGSLLGRSDLQSAEIRVILAHFSLFVACRHWTHGIGPFETKQLMYDMTGFPDAVNSTPLDMFLIGGVWGVLAFCVYWLIVVRCCVRICRRRPLTAEGRLVVLMTVVMCMGSVLLSLTYNSIWWLLPTVALAYERLTSSPRPTTLRRLCPQPREVNHRATQRISRVSSSPAVSLCLCGEFSGNLTFPKATSYEARFRVGDPSCAATRSPRIHAWPGRSSRGRPLRAGSS